MDLTGQRFGALEVLRVVKKDNISRCECKCECGNLKLVGAGDLRYGHSTSCGCHIHSAKKISRGGFGEISGNVWRRIVDNAKTRKGAKSEFSVTIEEVWEIFLKQNRKCALSGISLYFPKNSKEYHSSMRTASLDRIDSSKGYLPGNVQRLHKDVNRLKNDFPQDQFLELCKQIVDHQRSSCKID